MERLGDDELFSIFKKIGKSSDRKSFFQVSKKFMRVACIRLIVLHNLYPAMLYDILPASPNLVSFRCYKLLSNRHMKLLAKSCPKLRYLYMVSVTTSEFELDFDDDGLCAVANACNDLVHVDISRRIHVGDVGIHSLTRYCKKLTLLDLSGCVRVTDESLKAIRDIYLHELNLKGCYLITDLGLKYLANGNIENCLFDLNLGECDRISDNGIIYLKQIVTLRYLNLSKCGVNVTDTGVVALLSKLPDMKILDLSKLINVTNISLFVIASNCLKLEYISLNGCEVITNEGLYAFAHHPNLNRLELFSCHNISWEDVKRVALTCSKLKCIRLSSRIKMPIPRNDVYKINNWRIDWE